MGLIAKLIDKAVLMVWLLSTVLKFDNLFIPVTVTLSAAAVSTLVQAIENVKIKSVIMILLPQLTHEFINRHKQ